MAPSMTFGGPGSFEKFLSLDSWTNYAETAELIQLVYWNGAAVN